ncbi:MAG: hypothetical protein JJU35_14075 [Balneolales bacterium]|nr:hypothetical protein [Balneolales bacterium]
MIFLNIFILLVIFISGSLLANYLMRLYGYPVPRSLSTREDKLLFLMKLVLFSMLTSLMLALLLIFGIDPLNLMGRSGVV